MTIKLAGFSSGLIVVLVVGVQYVAVMATPTTPDQFIPARPADFLGQASALASKLLAQMEHLRAANLPATAQAGRPAPGRQQAATVKLCFYGAPGCGKTSLVNLAARALVSRSENWGHAPGRQQAATVSASNLWHPDIEEVNGRDLTIDRVRDWMQGSAYGSLFGGWRVKVINEMDLVPLAAQDLLLTYLDTLPPQLAILGTSNESRDTLSQRFCSRFQQVKVSAPTQEEIAGWLVKRWKVARKAADWIALTACGNVREACLQATAWINFGCLPEEKKPAAPAVCASASDAARRAWETRRNNSARAVA
jgi:energy-coupling factor transporter ATP-binding protein EcfA2